MKRITLFLFLFANLHNCEAQIAKCQFFLLTYEIDGHGKWLDFVNDSVCVYSVGSLSWGTNSDTLKYKIERGTVVVFSKDSSDVLLKLAIDKVSNRKHKKVSNRYSEGRQNYYQTNGKAVGKIYVLKPFINEALSIDTFSVFPDEIDGCACYFSNNAEEMAKHSYIYANNYGEISFLKINGVMMRFVQYDFQEISATSNIAKYRYGNYELKVVANDGERNGDESWLKSGTIELSNNKGEKLIKSFYGECGC